MSLSDTLKFVIDADSKSFVKGVSDAEKAADKSLGQVESRIDKVGAGMTKFGAGAMAFAAVAGAGLIKLGSDASGMAIEMGKGADATGLTVEQFSRLAEVAGDIGIPVEALEKSLGFMNKTLGNSPEKFKQLGIEVVRAKDGTVDANATFLNVVDRLNAIKDPSERAAAAAKLLGRGWQEMAELIATGSGPLAASMAAVSDAKVISPAELAKAKEFRAAMDQMKDAGQDLAIALGQGVAPVMASIAKAVAGAVDVFAKLDAVTSGAAGKFLGIGTAVIGAAGALSFVTGKVLTAHDRFDKLFKHMDGPGAGSWNKLGKAAGKAGIVLGVAAAAYGVFAANAAGDKKNLETAARAIEEVTRAATTEEINSYYAAWKIMIDLAGKDAVNNFDDMARANLEAAIVLRDSGVVAQDNAEYQKALEKAINDEIAATKRQDAATAAATAEQEANTGAVDAGAVAARALAAADTVLTAARVESRRAMHEHTTAMGGNILATDEAIRASSAAAVELWNSQRAAQAARDTQNDLAAAHARSAAAARDQKTANEELSGELSEEAAFLNLAQQLDDVTQSAKDVAAEIAAGTLSAEEGMRRQALAVNSVKQAVLAYGEQIGGLPVEKQVRFAAMIDQGKYDAVLAQLAVLERNRTMQLSIDVKGGVGLALPGNISGARAKGGPVSPGGAYLVGEDGPELLQMGSQGGHVVPNGAIVGSGGSPTVVHQHFYRTDPRSVRAAQVKEARRNGRQ